MHLTRQGFNPATQFLNALGQNQILLQQCQHLGALLEGGALLLRTRGGKGLAVLDVGLGEGLVAVGLPGLRQQDEWSRVCRLQAEGEVEEDERVDVERCKSKDIDENPHSNNDSLGDEKARRAKKASERFSLQGKPIVAKN